MGLGPPLIPTTITLALVLLRLLQALEPAVLPLAQLRDPAAGAVDANTPMQPYPQASPRKTILSDTATLVLPPLITTATVLTTATMRTTLTEAGVIRICRNCQIVAERVPSQLALPLGVRALIFTIMPARATTGALQPVMLRTTMLTTSAITTCLLMLLLPQKPHRRLGRCL